MKPFSGNAKGMGVADAHICAQLLVRLHVAARIGLVHLNKCIAHFLPE